MSKSPLALVGLALSLLVGGASLSAAPLPEPAPWTWQPIARFGGSPVRGAQVFVLADAAYLVSGMADDSIPHHQVWRYDATTNAWTRKADFPGTPIIEGVGFSIGAAGYIALGNTNGDAGLVKEFWQYDPATDVWTRKVDFPGSARSGCVAVTIGRKAYVFAGYSSGHLKELWEYDQDTDVWTRKADCPGSGRFLPAAFAIGSKAYFGTGALEGGASAMSQDFWEYDPSSDAWKRKADFPGAARAYALGLSLGGKGYVAFGLLSYTEPLPLVRDVWEYDPASDAWTPRGEFGASARVMATGFVLGSDLYYGAGNDSSVRNLPDFWRMRPAPTNP